MNQEVILNVLFYIKRTIFRNEENNNLIELIYITKEEKEIKNGISLTTPEIMTSYINEFNKQNVTGLKLSYEEGIEQQVYITQEEAEYLVEIAADEQKFVEACHNILNA
ncbi:hypothetical protein [Cytobacillus oceanisediminis]|uniref:hypothetical protein n=1 Tax=Cytobacillus oceanisediminis TaxID=665099 RepID=UPI00203DBD4E|nr:hypothetical protein [Cytobacillus oceanisediminis]MCM3393297.1 hypothetical protein [Cytobacillus oceanisediminis]